ncbi:VOC family protein [Nguyenibacter vanlangensis]|uniref:VOC family protein n=1 Tax=Nguyenibacter vanlangensis TaxID=1216886 RepID=A0ABZ3D8J8_9PROT
MLQDISMIDALHHVAIICSDYGRSKDFYTRILGLPMIRETYRAARKSWKCDLAVGTAQIELFSFPNPPPRPSRPEAQGLRHLAFTVRDLRAVVRRLEEAGIEVEAIRTDALTGRDFTFFADPDDLPLELYELAPGT